MYTLNQLAIQKQEFPPHYSSYNTCAPIIELSVHLGFSQEDKAFCCYIICTIILPQATLYSYIACINRISGRSTSFKFILYFYVGILICHG